MISTIVAIATGTVNAGISIIRLSGPKSLSIANKLTPKLDLNTVEPRKMYLTTITYEDISDIGLVVYMKAPNTFTGEEVVEFHLHGGQVLANHIVTGLVENGATIAMPGEFSRRAFMNGKLSLDSAEGVIDMINANSKAEISAGYNLLSGSLKKTSDEIQTQLTDLIAEIEVALDYPEQDIEYATEEKLKQGVLNIQDKLTKLISSYKTGQIIKNGINVAIVGKPNVGKSSLLNALLNYERAIVTEIAGTTRDTLEESYEYNGIRVNVVDTAGIRESEDSVEKIGIERSKSSINQAHVVMFVIDSKFELDRLDHTIIDLILKSEKPVIVVINKIDVSYSMADKLKEEISSLIPDCNIVMSSTLNKIGIEEIKQTIYSLSVTNDFNQNALFITNTRHLTALKDAYNSLESANTCIGTTSLDCVMLDIRDAWNSIALITGKSITEEVLDSIFSKFCLGK